MLIVRNEKSKSLIEILIYNLRLIIYLCIISNRKFNLNIEDTIEFFLK